MVKTLSTRIPSWVLLFRTLTSSFGFGVCGLSLIQTLTCVYVLLPSAFAGLLGYGYGEGKIQTGDYPTSNNHFCYRKLCCLSIQVKHKVHQKLKVHQGQNL